MSILIAYKKGDTVYMGTDTRVIVGGCKRNELGECNYKIQKLDNGILVGVVGERMERQTLLANAEELFTLDKKGELTKKHIVKEIIPNLYGLLYTEKLMVEKDDELPYMKADILLAYKDTFYQICTCFMVIKYEDFQALGPGVAACAQATLLNTKETDDINARIVKALKIAAKHSQKVGAPYLLIDTKDQKYTLVKGDEEWLLQ
ncbi:MAG: hypothetical protein IJB97_09380 [Clostridia bacterium]|nr:hypothetical protein [Clostridia bacterium]